MITTYDYIDSNRRKTFLLIVLFPISLLLLLFVSLYLAILAVPEMRVDGMSVISQIFECYGGYFFACVILSCIWTVIAFHSGKDMILKMVDAVKANDNIYDKEIKRILENVSITAGIPTPTLYILETEKSLNAFAVGTSKEKSAVVLTRGITERLDKSELEAVLAHEVAHIVHQDTKLMMAVTLLIGFFTLLGSFILSGDFGGGSGGRGGGRRTSSSRKGGGKNAGIIIIIGLVLYLFGTFVAPFIRFAISRTREFEADAKSALLTRNPQALISALQKISARPVVFSIEENELLSPMCIVSPLREKLSLFDVLSNLSSTHPPIEKRIKALEAMDGRNI